MSPILAGSIVFVASASVLILEIMAGRMLAPYVGVSLETYTGIIGTVLGGIALGTWLGGRLADRVDPRRTLGPITVAGGVLALAAVPAVALFGALPLGDGPVSIVLLALVGFFAPAAVLSAVAPQVIKVQLRHLDETGTVVGRLSALSTAGAIVGTFAAGFILVAALPSRTIVLVLGIGLICLGVGLWIRLRRGQPSAGSPPATALVVALAVTAASVGTPAACDAETTYFCARLLADPERPNGRTLVLDDLRHSYVDLVDPTYLEFAYARTLADVIDAQWPERAPLRALHIGGGAFTMPRWLAATRPGSASRVLELDAQLVRLVQDRLGVRIGPALEVEVGDARLGLETEATGFYDLVIGDAFGGRAVPWHLTTVEFLREVARTLRPDGLYAMNLIDDPPLGFARAEATTFQAVFPHVAVVGPPARLGGAQGGNFIVLGSASPLPLAEIAERNGARAGPDAILATGQELDAFRGDGIALTDDFAPVDQLLSDR